MTSPTVPTTESVVSGSQIEEMSPQTSSTSPNQTQPIGRAKLTITVNGPPSKLGAGAAYRQPQLDASAPAANAANSFPLPYTTSTPARVQTIIEGGQTYVAPKASESAYITSDRTLSPSSVITVNKNNVALSIPTSTSSIVVGSDTFKLHPTLARPLGGPAAITPLVLQGQTLPRGGSITVENTPFPLPSSGSDVVVGSNTIPLDSQATAISTGSQVLQISQGPPSDLVVSGDTPAPGSAVTVNGITVSLPVLGTNAVVDGTPTSLGGAIRSGWRTLPTTDATAVTMGGSGTGNGSVVPFLGKDLRNSMAGGHFWWTLAVILLGGVGIVGLI